MSIIIRLQNLPWSANALDIRQFFRGLSIPEGGVHIVGGELGDAFIAFSTDEDARQAFQLNNGKIKEVQIQLLLSSRTEMQKVIEAARNKQTPFAAAVPQPAIVPPVAAVQHIPDKKDDSKDKSKDDSRSSKDRRERRRSRSRTRSRDRDRRDRSRDRRDRRRRDRSRSRDRRDRRRDRRSKSRERTRSRERDTRRSRDKKRDSRDESRNDIPNQNNGNKTDLNEQTKPQLWDRNQRMPQMPPNTNAVANAPSLLGNYPGPNANTQLEDARRSLGLVTGLQSILTGQSSLLNLPNLNNGLQREENMLKRDNWQGNKNRFQDRQERNPMSDRNSMQDRNPMQEKLGMGGHFPPNQNRPMLGQNEPMSFGGNQRNLPMFPNSSGLRMPFSQELGSNLNRPFMSRPSQMMQNDLLPPSRNMPPNDFHFNKMETKDEPFQRDNRNRMDGGRMESCVQLRPYFGGYGEIRRFFHRLHISNTGIKFPLDCEGKRTGLCFIKFVKPQHRSAGLRLSGNMLRNINVEVSPLPDEEFDKCGNQDVISDEEREGIVEREETFSTPQPFTCLVVEDLPTFAKEHDILKMFSDYSLLGINIESQNRRRMAYVQFSKEEDAAKALEDKNKHFLGGKPISVHPSAENKFADIINASEQPAQDMETVKPETIEIKDEDNEEPEEQFPDNAASFDTDVVLLTGLPFKTTDRDVIDFFSDIGLVPIKIHMSVNKIGPAECYCEFASPSEAVAALDKNGMPLGTGVVNVEPCPRKEMERNLGFHGKPPIMNHMPNQRFLGRLGPRPGLIGMSPRPLMATNMMRPPIPMNRFDGPVDNMGPIGCVLAMENVPFKAGTEEILDFFENFDITTHSILRRYNNNGTPTGDARVTFNSPVEAHRAYDECRFKKIRDRTIFLRVL